MHNFDARALSEPIDRNELRAFKASLPQRFPHSHHGRATRAVFGSVMWPTV